jgi:hypothetical protein
MMMLFILKIILQDFERLIRPEAVVNQNSWFLMRLSTLVWGLNTYTGHSKLILELMYPDLEHV